MSFKDRLQAEVQKYKHDKRQAMLACLEEHKPKIREYLLRLAQKGSCYVCLYDIQEVMGKKYQYDIKEDLKKFLKNELKLENEEGSNEFRWR